MKAISITRHGGADVMNFADVAQPVPKEGELLVQVLVAGVNYIDTYFREGIYPHDLPFTPGFEGVGLVAEDPLGEIAVGTKVAWCDGFGSYAQFVTVPRDRVVQVPRGMDDAVAASMLLQGITAHYLVQGVYELGSGDTCLITAGAGGVGLMATQLAVAQDARVFTLCSTEEKAELSRAAGAERVFGYDDDWVTEIRELTGGEGVNVVYDGVGASTFERSLDVTRLRGTVALFGAASGPVPPVDPQTLNAHGSLFLTRPSIGAYTARPGEFVMRAQAVINAINDGVLNVRVGATFSLAEAAAAHKALQNRETVGSIVLTVPEV